MRIRRAAIFLCGLLFLGCHVMASYISGDARAPAGSDLGADATRDVPNPSDTRADGVLDAPRASADTGHDARRPRPDYRPEARLPFRDLGTTACASGTWCSMSNPASSLYDLRSVWGTASNDVWAVGDGGTILHFNGTTWVRVNSGTSSNLRAVWGVAPKRVWAVGEKGTLLEYNGGSWSTRPVLVGRTYNGVGGGSAIYAVGEQLNSGYAEQLHPISSTRSDPATLRYNAIWGVGATVYVVGQTSTAIGRMYKVGTGGWTSVSLPATAGVLYGIWGTPALERVVVVGFDIGKGSVLEFNSGAWTITRQATGRPLYGVGGGAKDLIYAVGQGGFIWRCKSASVPCKPWVPEASGVVADLYSVWAPNTSVVFAVGAKGTILRKR